jgi:hypothetical protein
MRSFTWKNTFIVLLILSLKQVPCELGSESQKPKDVEDAVTNISIKSKTIGSPGKSIKKLDPSKKRGFDITKFQGWGGAPDAVESGQSLSENDKKEFYYLKVKARASAKSIENKSESMMQITCQDSARLTGVDKIFATFMDAYFLEKAPEEKRGTVKLEYPDKNISYTCKYSPDEKNQKIINRECKGIIREQGIYGCWAGASNSWSDCECLTYMKFPGGKEGIESKISYE